MTLITVEATIDKDGLLQVDDEIDLKGKRVLITVLPANEYDLLTGDRYAALMSQEVLARDWDTPEEDEAWAHLQDLDPADD